MTNNNCHFTWLKQKETMITLAQSLYKDSSYFDCQLCAEGHHFNVHRVILSCNSPVLSSILQEHKMENPVITLDGVSPLELGALVEFMYTGVTRISSNLLLNFFQTAKSLQLAGLGHYDDVQIDKFLGEDESACIEEAELQDGYGSYNQNVLNCLEMDDEVENSNPKELQTINTEEGNIFLDTVIDRTDLMGDNSVEYDKYENVFVKQDVPDQNLEQTDSNCDNFNERNNTGASIENSNISTPFSKIQTVLVNESNDVEAENLIDNPVTTVYSVCKEEDADVKEENEYITVDNKIQVADEDENYVFVNIDSSVFHRIKENQVRRVKQEKNDSELCEYSDKYVKVINPSKKNFKKRPKLQNAIGKDVKGASDDKKIYICLKCGNKYSHRRTLLHHIHWICEQPATYSCSLCPYMGKRKFQLKSHMKHAHMLRMS